MEKTEIENMAAFVKVALEGTHVVDRLERIVHDGNSKAGTRREEVFTREFLCPTIASYFESKRHVFGLSTDQMRSGLGTEGYKNCPGFGFTPASTSNNLFTKSDVIQREVPRSWLKSNGTAPSTFQACPDFAIRPPLPFSAVGEVKYFIRPIRGEAAAREVFNAARQATFYLATFRAKFQSAIIILADASPKHSLIQGMNLIHPALLKRFGAETGIHLVALQLQ